MSDISNRWALPAQPRTISKFERYHSLQKNWIFSVEFLEYLSTQCQGTISDNVETIAVAGSFGRLEGSCESDADYIMVVKDPKHTSVERVS